RGGIQRVIAAALHNARSVNRTVAIDIELHDHDRRGREAEVARSPVLRHALLDDIDIPAELRADGAVAADADPARAGRRNHRRDQARRRLGINLILARGLAPELLLHRLFTRWLGFFLLLDVLQPDG